MRFATMLTNAQQVSCIDTNDITALNNVDEDGNIQQRKVKKINSMIDDVRSCVGDMHTLLLKDFYLYKLFRNREVVDFRRTLYL